MQAHEIYAGTRRARARLGGRNPRAARPNPSGRPPAGLSISPARAGDKPLQLIPREPIPQAQRRERNRLRPVRIETEQPRPDQAI
jgi:hypothetical protein